MRVTIPTLNNKDKINNDKQHQDQLAEEEGPDAFLGVQDVPGGWPDELPVVEPRDRPREEVVECPQLVDHLPWAVDVDE